MDGKPNFMATTQKLKELSLFNSFNLALPFIFLLSLSLSLILSYIHSIANALLFYCSRAHN
jgi:hypothetical protein